MEIALKRFIVTTDNKGEFVLVPTEFNLHASDSHREIVSDEPILRACDCEIKKLQKLLKKRRFLH